MAAREDRHLTDAECDFMSHVVECATLVIVTAIIAAALVAVCGCST